MKKLLFIVFCCLVANSYAETYGVNDVTKKRKRYRYRSSKPKPIEENPNDSAYIYYNLGWDAYKTQDFGAARYYWERGANCESNIPSRYNCAFRLALLNQQGEGIGVNYDVAFYYYNLAYANGQKVGNVDATKNIAAYYENGMCVSTDYYKALEWYKKAKAQGNKYCNDDIVRVTQKIKEYGRGS